MAGSLPGPARQDVAKRAYPTAVTQLYRQYAADGTLLYIGISNNAFARTGQHAKKPWAGKVARVEIVPYPTRERAKRAECFAIGNERPIYNKDWSGQVPMSAIETGKALRFTLAQAYEKARRGLRFATIDPVEFEHMSRHQRREHRRMWKRLARRLAS
jgi:hypothetical protein